MSSTAITSSPDIRRRGCLIVLRLTAFQRTLFTSNRTGSECRSYCEKSSVFNSVFGFLREPFCVSLKESHRFFSSGVPPINAGESLNRCSMSILFSPQSIMPLERISKRSNRASSDLTLNFFSWKVPSPFILLTVEEKGLEREKFRWRFFQKGHS